MHGHLGLVHAAVQGRAGVVQGQGRIGISGDAQIDQAGLHHVRLHLPKEQPQQGTVPQQGRPHAHQGKQKGEQVQLPCGQAAVLPVPAADILADHHRPAGGQGREQKNEKGVQHVHQGNAGHSGLSRIADHQRVGNAHQHGQQLLHKQRRNQPL